MFLHEKPISINLILTNKKSLFKNSRAFEVGILDHHYLVLTSIRNHYIQGNPKIILYRNYKHVRFEAFSNKLNELLKAEKDKNYSLFENIFLQVLNPHAPLKKKVQKFNSNPFMTKHLCKAINHPSRLKIISINLAQL